MGQDKSSPPPLHFTGWCTNTSLSLGSCFAILLKLWDRLGKDWVWPTRYVLVYSIFQTAEKPGKPSPSDKMSFQPALKMRMPSEKGNCAICEKVSCKNLYKQELFKHLNCFALILIRMQIAETFDLLRKSRSDMFCLKRQIPKIGFKFQNWAWGLRELYKSK